MGLNSVIIHKGGQRMGRQELAVRIDNAVEGLTKELEYFACVISAIPAQAPPGSGYRLRRECGPRGHRPDGGALWPREPGRQHPCPRPRGSEKRYRVRAVCRICFIKGRTERRFYRFRPPGMDDQKYVVRKGSIAYGTGRLPRSTRLTGMPASER